jgi:uncharacterized membrane protein YqaE (UPF0057 family)
MRRLLLMVPCFVVPLVAVLIRDGLSSTVAGD